MRISEPYTIFLRTFPSGKQVYYYQFRDNNGVRSAPKSTGCDTLSKARRFCQKLYNENKFDTSTGITFSMFTQDFFSPTGEFCKWKEINNRPLKPETLRRYNLSLNLHILPFFGSMQLEKINRNTCKKWIIWASEKWTPKTINNAQSVLNLIFESAVERDKITYNPLYKLGFRKLQKKKRDLLSVSEISALYNLDWNNDVYKQAFLLAAITGMRLGEIMALQYDDIKGNYISVTKNYSDRYGMQDSTKTYMNRYVPIPADFPFPVHDDVFIFSDTGKTPFKGHCIYNAFVRRCALLNIDRIERGITIHSLRNFFVSYLQQNNITEAKIRAVVGHADETMTDLYTYWKPDMFPEVYEVQKKLFYEITRGTQCQE